jgi:5-methylcytosine-specific restriction endonuclease McrA
MAFSEAVKDQAFARSGGRCECHRQHNAMNASHHGGRCPKTFTRHGGQWEAHHIVSVLSGGSDTLSNCEVLCLDCHNLVRTYGNR